MCDNKVKIEFYSKSENEGFARVSIAAFITQLDPTIDEVTDVKTAVSEAVTNCIIHGYDGRKDQKITIEASLKGREIEIEITDYGKGIKNIEEAMEPLYTSRPDLERSGMGFTVMETFMDKISVESVEGKGTKVKLNKKFNSVG